MSPPRTELIKKLIKDQLISLVEAAGPSHLAGRVFSCDAPRWDLVDALLVLEGALGPRAVVLVVALRRRRGGGGRLGLEGRSDQQLEAVSRSDALAAVQRAEPPALQAAGVLLHHRQDVPFPEGQLLGGLGHVVVQRFGHQVLRGQTQNI